MQSLACVLGVVLAGCAGVGPQLRPVQPMITLLDASSDQRMVVGGRLEVMGDWAGTCRDNSALAGNLKSSSPDERRCEEKPFTMEIRCRGECQVGPPRDNNHALMRDVIALSPGRLVVEATSHRTDTDEVFTQSFEVEVVAADGLVLGCLDPKTDGFPPCGPLGVSAAHPMIMAEIVVGNDTKTSTALRVNGQALDLRRKQWFSLARLFPDRAVGDRVAPGTYPVELQLGDQVEHFNVVAR